MSEEKPENNEEVKKQEERRRFIEGFEGQGISLSEVGLGDYESFQAMRRTILRDYGPDSPAIAPQTFPLSVSGEIEKDIQLAIEKADSVTGIVAGRVFVNSGEAQQTGSWTKFELSANGVRFSAGFIQNPERPVIGPIDLPNDNPVTPKSENPKDPEALNMMSRFVFKAFQEYSSRQLPRIQRK